MQNENAKGERINLQGSGGVVVTPSNTSDIPGGGAKGIRLENVADGNVITLVFPDDSTLQLTLKTFDHGYHPWIVKRINATGTTGTLRIIAIQ